MSNMERHEYLIHEVFFKFLKKNVTSFEQDLLLIV